MNFPTPLCTSFFAITLLFASASLTAAQIPPPATGADPLIKQTFKENEEGWTAMGPNAKTAVTTSPAETGGALIHALRFDYTIAKGEMGVLALPLTEVKLSRAKSVRFRIKADYTTPIVFALQEKEGGRWTATFTVPQGKWQTVQLSPSDFVLTQGKDDPADTNKKLDLDRIEYAGIIDLSQFFAQADNAALTALFTAPKGDHTLYLADFTVSPDPLPGNAVSSATGIIDTFGRPQVGWISFGATTLSHVSGKPLESRALQASYRQAPGKFAGALRPVGAQTFTGRTHLSFQVAPAKPAKLLIQLEEKGGGKYNTMLTLTGESNPKNLSLLLSDFVAADDSKDSNERFDLDQITQIIVLDISGILDSADDDNTLWIGNLRAETKPVTSQGI